MTKRNPPKLKASIKGEKSKFYCKLSITEHVSFDEIIIRVIRRSRQTKRSRKQRWFDVFKPTFLLKQITEIVKAMF